MRIKTAMTKDATSGAFKHDARAASALEQSRPGVKLDCETFMSHSDCFRHIADVGDAKVRKRVAVELHMI